MQAEFDRVFETETEVFPVATGTAANSLALATVTPPYGVVYSPAGSHAASDECNAPESAMSGAKFIAVRRCAAPTSRPRAAAHAHQDQHRSLHSNPVPPGLLLHNRSRRPRARWTPLRSTR